MYAEWEAKANSRLEELLKKDLNSETTSASFYQNLGNAFSVLEKDPQAIGAYEKSLSLNPWNQSVRIKLEALQEKLFLPSDSSFSIPLPFIYQGFTLFFVLYLISIKIAPKIARVFAFLVFCSLLVLTYALLLEPSKGVIMSSSYLYPTPSYANAPVSQEPVASGSKVEVLDEENKGTWLKVRDREGNIGYIYYSSIQLI